MFVWFVVAVVVCRFCCVFIDTRFVLFVSFDRAVVCDCLCKFVVCLMCGEFGRVFVWDLIACLYGLVFVCLLGVFAVFCRVVVMLKCGMCCLCSSVCFV